MAASTRDQAPDREQPEPVPLVVRTIIEILRASSTITAVLTPEVRRFGLSPPAFNVLHTLVHSDGPLKPSAISRSQVIPAQTVTSVLDSLERRGLIERLPHAGDRRILLASLTEEGLALYQQCCEPLLTVESHLLSGLTEPEMEQLRLLLGRIKRR